MQNISLACAEQDCNKKRKEIKVKWSEYIYIFNRGNCLNCNVVQTAKFFFFYLKIYILSSFTQSHAVPNYVFSTAKHKRRMLLLFLFIE